MKERYLQLREAEIHNMLRAMNERREAVTLQERSLEQQLAVLRGWEQRLKEASLTQQTAIEKQRNGANRESDLVSLASTVRNSSSNHTNVDISSKSSAFLKEDSEYYGNEDIMNH